MDGGSIRYTIIIPTYGRPAALARCLEFICALDYAEGDFEVIVVDDGDSRETRAVAERFVPRRPIQYLSQRKRTGPANARNAGALAARGRYLVFVDDDCVPDSRWLRAFDEALAREEDADVVLGGRVENAVPTNPYAIASQNLIDFLYGWYNADPEQARFFASNNLACRRSSFHQLDGFDYLFRNAAAEDRDFCDRWRESGRRMVYVGNAIVRHLHRATLGQFVRQHATYGRGAVDLHEGRERRHVDRPRLEPIAFYYQLLTYPMWRGFGMRTPYLVVLAFVSQAAYAWGYYTERWARGRGKTTAREARPASR